MSPHSCEPSAGAECLPPPCALIMVWVRDNRQRIVECIRARMPPEAPPAAETASEMAGVVRPKAAVVGEPAPPTGFEWGLVA